MRAKTIRLSAAVLAASMIFLSSFNAALAKTTFDGAPFIDIHTQDEVVTLPEPGKPIERELSGGQVHSYHFSLAAGEYLQVVVEQRGINVGVVIFATDGKQIIEIDNSNDPKGVEEVLLIADVAGAYQLRVRAVEKEKAAGRYEVKVKERRPATALDGKAFADWLSRQVTRLRAARQFDAAIPLARRGLAIRERGLQPDAPELLPFLNTLALVYRDNGEYAQAEPLFERALKITEKQNGSESIEVAQALNALASLSRLMGEYARAEPLLERALAIVEKRQGADHPDTATVLNNLASVYSYKGDYKRAEPRYQRALEIRQKQPKPDDLLIAQSLNNLAVMYYDKGDFAQAEPLYKRALEIREKLRGTEHVEVAQALSNLALVSQSLGDLERAEPLYQRALNICQKAGISDHREAAHALNSLAVLTLLKGDYAKAEPMYQRALEIREKTLGQQHPLVAKTLDTFAVLYDLKGDIARAVEMRNRCLEIRERHLTPILTTGSEEQKRAYLAKATLSDENNITISLHARSAPKDPQAASMALNMILQRKGRVLDAMADSIGTLRRRLDPQGRELLEQLSAVNSRLATLTLSEQGSVGGAQYKAEVERLESERQRLEAAISSKSVEFGLQSQPVTLDRVRKLIPADAALLEIAGYRPFDRKAKKVSERFGPPRYVAYVLKPQGPPAFVELGEAAAIDRNINLLRDALRSPKRADVRRLARRLDQQVMRPIRALLGQTRKVLISPDGALNLVPFAALLDERNRYLVRRYSFSYLTSGRDLIRLEARQPGKQGAVIVADPVFGEMADEKAAQGRKLLLGSGSKKPGVQTLGGDGQGIDFSQVYFRPLPGTAGEARRLKVILPQATLLTREQATEAAAKQVSGPSVLHIATHGFFLDDMMFARGAGRGLGLPAKGTATTPAAPTEENIQSVNPLLRSGLALAGANLRKSGEEDGILTALEVAGLDLQGTRLVVLSACDTGVGEVRAGDGVYGLRRALVLAGSEAQVMSLWPVSDFATRDLMTEYYRALQQGQGRTEALRRVQIKMLRGQAGNANEASRILITKGQQSESSTEPRRKRDYRHPYYWASFIQSGEWGNLDGKR